MNEPSTTLPRRWRHSARRVLHHLFVGHWSLRRDFPTGTLKRIERAVIECESRHPGQIRVVVEAALHPLAVWRGVTPRDRAVDLFGRLRVWDTEHNNGVLVYLLLADRDVEIVADRGVAGGRIQPGEWDTVCRLMEDHCRAGRFEQAGVAGVEAVAGVLLRYPPVAPRGGDNELPDAPVLIA